MSGRYSVLWLTDRGQRHQQAALDAAPGELSITMLRRPPKEEMLRRLPEIDVLVSERTGIIDADMIRAGQKLRLIQRLGSTSHDIDLAAAREAGVPVCIWPLPTTIKVAEHMVLQILALIKRLPEVAVIANEAGDWGIPSRRTDEDTFAVDWSKRSGVGSIYNQTIGILGFGEIGVELARRLAGFSPSRILYHKRSRLPETTEAELGLTYGSPDILVAESDIVCNLLPYYPETDLLINGDWFSRMKRGACLISCGSGSVIDEAALVQALQAGHLSGAALDTFEWEPIRPNNPLLALARDPESNVLLTPHTAAGSSRDADSDQTRKAEYTNILRLLRGEPLLHRVA